MSSAPRSRTAGGSMGYGLGAGIVLMTDGPVVGENSLAFPRVLVDAVEGDLTGNGCIRSERHHLGVLLPGGSTLFELAGSGLEEGRLPLMTFSATVLSNGNQSLQSRAFAAISASGNMHAGMLGTQAMMVVSSILADLGLDKGWYLDRGAGFQPQMMEGGNLLSDVVQGRDAGVSAEPRAVAGGARHVVQLREVDDAVSLEGFHLIDLGKFLGFPNMEQIPTVTVLEADNGKVC